MPAISVIIPCYNVESFLDRCLTSVTSQTIGLSNLEIICIDDASTDNTWSKLRKWESNYPEHFLLIHCEQNGRQGKARNIGLSYASAPYIAFIDSDDWVELDYLEKLYHIMREYNCDVVTCQNERDHSTGLSYFSNRLTGKSDRYLLIDTIEKHKVSFFSQSLSYSAWGKLICKDFLLNNHLLFPENLAYEDCYWGPLFLLHVSSAYIIEEKLYHYFVNQTSTVLYNNSDYHIDHLTVNLMTWEEYQCRGLLPVYQDELEFDFLFTCYLAFLKIIILRYETPSFSQFLLLKHCVLNRIPDYKNNPYIKQGNYVSDIQALILETLSLPINKVEFLEFVETVKKTGFI